MKLTQSFLATSTRADRVMIKDEWIRFTIDHPIRGSIQSDGGSDDGRGFPKRIIVSCESYYLKMARRFILPSLTVDSKNDEMKVQYFGDTDTLYVVLNEKPVVETKDLDENTLIDL